MKTGFGLQIVKWTVLEAVLPNTFVMLAVSLNSPGLKPLVLSLAVKWAVFGWLGKLFFVMVLPRNRTSALFSPASAIAVIGNLSVFPVASQETIDVAFTVGGGQYWALTAHGPCGVLDATPAVAANTADTAISEIKSLRISLKPPR